MSNSSTLLQMMFSNFVMHVPLLLVSLLGLIVVFTRWRQAGRAAAWAALGFGLVFVLCFAIPILQTTLQHWLMQNGQISNRAGLFTALSVFWSILRAATYVFLLVAVFAGRPMPDDMRQ